MNIEPKVIKLSDAYSVAGISVRTINSDEFNPSTAKLSALWGQFVGDDLFNKIPHKKADSPVYGVYSNYESDETGFYQVTAGVAVDEVPQGSDLKCVKIQSGDYLVFENSGEMPQMVIDAWTEVWAYFEANPQVKRAFATDFELYTSEQDVAIYIGILNH